MRIMLLSVWSFCRRLLLSLPGLLLLGLIAPSPLSAYLGSHDSPRPRLTPPDAIRARAALLIDGTTGEVLYARNPDERHPPASTAKLMTALLAFEKYGLNGEVTITSDDMHVERSWIPVIPGEIIPIKTLFYALLIHSANDAARALARSTAGSTEEFVDLMNRRASAMGLDNTHYVNPNGLPEPDEFTSCADLLKVFRAAMVHPELRKICSTKTYHLDTRAGYQLIKNHNLLLGAYPGVAPYPGMGPAKTGWTESSNHTYAAEASRNGRVLQLTLLDTRDSWGDARILFDWGFATESKVSAPAPIAPDPSQVYAPVVHPLPSLPGIVPPVSTPIPTQKITLGDGRVFTVISYTVSPGDTLSSLSQQHHCSVGDLVSLNTLPRRSRIFAGQELLVPADE